MIRVESVGKPCRFIRLRRTRLTHPTFPEILRELPIYPYVTMDVVELEPHSLTVGR